MEDKKVKAGSIAVGICLFIIAVLLVVIVLVFYNSTVEKNNLQDKISELETTIKEKDKNYNHELNVEIDSETNKLNDREARIIIEKFLRIRGSYTGSPLELCLFDSELNLNADYSTQTSDGYVSTSIEYNDFKNEMLKYMSEDLFETYEMYKNIDGILYAFNGGASGIGYSDIKLTLISSSNNIYEYSVECLEYPPEEGEKVSYIFEISYINEKYVVSNYKYN